MDIFLFVLNIIYIFNENFKMFKIDNFYDKKFLTCISGHKSCPIKRKFFFIYEYVHKLAIDNLR